MPTTCYLRTEKHRQKRDPACDSSKLHGEMENQPRPPTLTWLAGALYTFATMAFQQAHCFIGKQYQDVWETRTSEAAEPRNFHVLSPLRAKSCGCTGAVRTRQAVLHFRWEIRRNTHRTTTEMVGLWRQVLRGGSRHDKWLLLNH